MKMITENWKRFLQETREQVTEATEEEIEYLGDLLEMPPSALPFDDFFNGKYRRAEEFKATGSTGILAELEKWFREGGWNMYLDESGEKPVLKASKTQDLEVTDKEGNRRQITKTYDLKVSKIASRILSFINNWENWKESYDLPVKTAIELAEKTKNMDDEERRKIVDEYKPKIAKMSKVSEKLMNSFEMLFGAVRWATWDRLGTDGTYFEAILGPESKKVADFLLDGSKLEDLTTNIDNYKMTNYIIYSRHPIDVYRMSDFRGLDSCHSLPSRKGNGTFDEYNICALAEAHGNGLISYVVTQESMREFVGAEEGQTITPEMIREKLDEHEMPDAEDGEIFEDDERNIEGMVPVSRIRIKNVSYNSNGDDNPIKLLVPQGNIYGQKMPGLVDHLYNTVVEAQKEKIEAIKEKEGDSVNMFAFTRYGGSYQDGGYRVRDALPRMFNIAFPDTEIEFVGSINYDNDMEQELMGEAGMMTEEVVEEEIQRVIDGLGISNNIDVNYEVEQWDESFSIRIQATVTFFVHNPRDTDITFSEAQEAANAIDEKLNEWAEAMEYDNMVDRVHVSYVENGDTKGYKIMIDLDDEFILKMSEENYFYYEDIENQLSTAFEDSRTRYGSRLGIDSLFTRGGPMNQMIWPVLQSLDLMEGGNEYFFGKLADYEYSDGQIGDFEFDFDQYHDEETGDPMSDGYTATGEYEYQKDEEEGIKIAALLNAAYGAGDEDLREIIRGVVHDSLGGPGVLKLPVDKMNIYFELIDDDEEEVKYKLSWSANEYHFKKKADIRSHFDALEKHADWEEINDDLVTYIDDHISPERIGLPPLSDEEKMERFASQPKPMPWRSFDEPPPEQEITESKRRLKLKILRG